MVGGQGLQLRGRATAAGPGAGQLALHRCRAGLPCRPALPASPASIHRLLRLPPTAARSRWQVIAKAKVPIVKFEDADTGYNFDLSFDVANGPEVRASAVGLWQRVGQAGRQERVGGWATARLPLPSLQPRLSRSPPCPLNQPPPRYQAAENVRALMDALPPMRPLVMVLKVFLQQRELNEVRCVRCEGAWVEWVEWVGGWVVAGWLAGWRRGRRVALHTHPTNQPPPAQPATPPPPPQVYSGGLGSYALLVLVAAFLQLHPSRAQPPSTHRYGSGRAAAAAPAGQLEGSLGVLLLDFLRLYGRALNNIEVGGRPGGGKLTGILS